MSNSLFGPTGFGILASPGFQHCHCKLLGCCFRRPLGEWLHALPPCLKQGTLLACPQARQVFCVMACLAFTLRSYSLVLCPIGSCGDTFAQGFSSNTYPVTKFARLQRNNLKSLEPFFNHQTEPRLRASNRSKQGSCMLTTQMDESRLVRSDNLHTQETDSPALEHHFFDSAYTTSSAPSKRGSTRSCTLTSTCQRSHCQVFKTMNGGRRE